MQRSYEILYPTFHKLRLEFNDVAANALAKATRRQRVDYPTLLRTTVGKYIRELEEIPNCDAFDDPASIAKEYAEPIDSIINNMFEDDHITDEIKDLLRRVALLVLTKNTFSDSLTGIVIAGFGHNAFPRLMAFEIDGIISGKLKKREVQRVNTGRSVITAEIIPFAQREMVDRFLYGVDPEFEEGIEEFLKMIVQTAGEILIERMPRTSRKTKKAMEGALQTVVDVGLRHWRGKMVPAVKKKFQQQIEDMLLLMPKQEMASLAEAMVNLTSVKRKFSAERETVAGPIDVAVISKSDGFV